MHGLQSYIYYKLSLKRVPLARFGTRLRRLVIASIEGLFIHPVKKGEVRTKEGGQQLEEGGN